MKRTKPLLVTLRADRPSEVEITVGDRIQIDRIRDASGTRVAERHGPLLDPGRHTVQLDPGQFCFRTLSDARLRVVRGGVTAKVGTNSKDPWPDPPDALSPAALPATRGDDPAGDEPSLILE